MDKTNPEKAVEELTMLLMYLNIGLEVVINERNNHAEQEIIDLFDKFVAEKYRG